MPVNRLYHMWLVRIQQIYPSLRITQQRTWVWLILGILLQRSVHLSRIASVLPGSALLLSHTRRLARWLDNPAIHVRSLYAPIARTLLAPHIKAGRVRLILDGTRIGNGHQLLMLALAVRKRALPLAWTWVRGHKGHSSAFKQRALLASIQPFLPADVHVCVVGDTEFEAASLQQQIEEWGWFYVLRQKPTTMAEVQDGAGWQALATLVAGPGQSEWYENGRLTERYRRRANVLAHWAVGEKKPWLLATNLPSRREALQAYRRRMWVEEMFGDMKGHGMDVETTRLQKMRHLSRLMLVVAVMYVWLMATGQRVIKRGERRLVDRSDRRDLSVFSIGWRSVERWLVNEQPLRVDLRCQC